jgi:hypothetical protein
MSVQAISWAYEQRTGNWTRKAVLVALANRTNHDTGLCCPSLDRVAEETELSRSTVIRAIADLEAAGLIQKTRRARENGSDTTNEYRLSLTPPGYQADTPPGVTVTPLEPKEDLELQEKPRTTPTPIAPPPSEPPPPRFMVDRKPVTTDHALLARAVLDVWNDETGQSLRSKDWLAKIVMRIREHPDFGLAEHAHVIHAALQDPWWSGPANPSVVYGNGAQFERCIERVRAGPLPKTTAKRFGRGMTTEQILAMRGGDT